MNNHTITTQQTGVSTGAGNEKPQDFLSSKRGHNVRRLVNRLAHELARSSYEVHREGLAREVADMRREGVAFDEVAEILQARLAKLMTTKK